jgi:hypothetical protein
MTPFSKHIQADGSVRWWQADPGRYVDAQQYQLVEWLAAGGVPDATPYVPPAAPTLADLRSAAISRFQAEAAECLRINLPTPWDVLRSVATPEFQAWAEAFMELVAAELARLEAAVAAAVPAAELAAIVADWPEVAA